MAAIKGLSTECAAELQGVRGKMLKMRAEVDAATERGDQLARNLQETMEQLGQTEDERNSLQRQTSNLNDQLYLLDRHLKEANDRLAESESNREMLINEVKGLNHRLNVMDAAEETFKQQLTAERERAAQGETEASEYKRNVARLQMDNEKLDHDMDMLRADHQQLMQQFKEAEDRIGELTSSYNQLLTESKQMASHRHHGHRHHEPKSINAAPAVQQQPQQGPPERIHLEIRQKEKELQDRSKDLEDALGQLSKREARIGKLENEIYIYQENHKILSDQLREVQQANIELKQQAAKMSQSSDQLTDAKEQNQSLSDQLDESEKRNASWEAKAAEMAARISQLESQLQDQKAAYGELYAQMNKTIKDIENTATNQGVCDF